MTPEERDRYGRLLRDIEREGVPIVWGTDHPTQDEIAQIVAERFIDTAGLVPLAEVRALVQDIINYVDEEAPIMDIIPKWFEQEAWQRFEARFGEGE